MKRRIVTVLVSSIALTGLMATSAQAADYVNLNHLTLNQAIRVCMEIEDATGRETTLYAYTSGAGRVTKSCKIW